MKYKINYWTNKSDFCLSISYANDCVVLNKLFAPGFNFLFKSNN